MVDFLITGGFGFQGYRLTKNLLEEGASVRVLARDSEHSRRNFKILDDWDDLRVQWGDVTNPETVRAAVRDCKIVIHLAAQINVDESIQHPWRALTSNVFGTYNVLDAVRLYGTKMIHASTCEVYGSATTPLMTEDHPLNPQSPYAATKAAADRLAYSYFCSYGIPLVIARPSNVYGWGQKAGKTGAVIARWMNAALRKEDITLYGDGDQGRDFLYIDDLVQGYRKLIELPQDQWQGQAFNFGTGICTSMKTIADIITLLGTVRVLPGAARAGEVISFALDSSKALQALQWRATVGIGEGLEKTWQEAQERGGF